MLINTFNEKGTPRTEQREGKFLCNDETIYYIFLVILRFSSRDDFILFAASSKY